MALFKFQAMFMGNAVIIEYELDGKEIDYAVITDDNTNFIHPDYEYFDDFLEKHHTDVLELTKNHLKKVLNHDADKVLEREKKAALIKRQYKKRAKNKSIIQKITAWLKS